jgi:hypothetical protein
VLRQQLVVLVFQLGYLLLLVLYELTQSLLHWVVQEKLLLAHFGLKKVVLN